MDSKFSARQQAGSDAAKSGFKNESDICNIFNSPGQNTTKSRLLKTMNYDVNNIRSVTAYQIPNSMDDALLTTILTIKNSQYSSLGEVRKFKKADILLIVETSLGNKSYEMISVKKFIPSANYNQLDKRSVDAYQKIWGYDDEVAMNLKYATGAVLPDASVMQGKKYEKRLIFSEMPDVTKEKIRVFFDDNKASIISDVVKGRGALAADWFLVTMVTKSVPDYRIKKINDAIKVLSEGGVRFSKRGSTLNIGRVVLQRKGGTPDPEKLQFKLKPGDVYNA